MPLDDAEKAVPKVATLKDAEVVEAVAAVAVVVDVAVVVAADLVVVMRRRTGSLSPSSVVW